jgi:hypothetical protein
MALDYFGFRSIPKSSNYFIIDSGFSRQLLNCYYYK